MQSAVGRLGPEISCHCRVTKTAQPRPPNPFSYAPTSQWVQMALGNGLKNPHLRQKRLSWYDTITTPKMGITMTITAHHSFWDGVSTTTARPASRLMPAGPIMVSRYAQ